MGNTIVRIKKLKCINFFEKTNHEKVINNNAKSSSL
jgi:hypothetical protein